MALQTNEFNVERPAYDVDISIEEMNLIIDPQQFSDLLDFIKFQNYSVLYGNECQGSEQEKRHSVHRSLP